MVVVEVVICLWHHCVSCKILKKEKYLNLESLTYARPPSSKPQQGASVVSSADYNCYRKKLSIWDQFTLITRFDNRRFFEPFPELVPKRTHYLLAYRNRNCLEESLHDKQMMYSLTTYDLILFSKKFIVLFTFCNLWNDASFGESSSKRWRKGHCVGSKLEKQNKTSGARKLWN